MSAAVIVAVSSVELTNVVARGEPFQFTTDPFTKFVPVTARVKLVIPQDGAEEVDVTDDDSEVTLGGTIVNVAAAGAGLVWVVPPPGPIVNTATWAFPRAWKSVAGTVAVSCVPLTYVVVSAAGGLLPLTHCTTEHGRILLPVTVSERAGEPAAMLDCDSDAMPGAARVVGDDKVNGKEFEFPTELETVTLTGPGNAVSVGRIEAVT